MKNKFSLQTSHGNYRCERYEKSVNGEKMTRWWVDVVLTNVVKCEFTCPENWAASRVFQFIESIDENFV